MAFKFKLIDQGPPVSIEAWRRLARRNLPDLAWNYVDGGADDLITLAENQNGFARWRLRQRCLAGIKKPTLATVIARDKMAFPVALAPTGAAGLCHWTADVAAARAAERAGTRSVLSTASSYTLEEVAEATDENHWFQLYPFGNRDKVASLMSRAKSAGYTALFVTVDVPVLGNREGERLAGMTHPWTLTPARVLNMACHPRWLFELMAHRRAAAVHYLERDKNVPANTLQNIRRAMTGAGDDAIASAEAQARYMQGDLHWDDLIWMREHWQGPLYVKGVLDPDDAQRAVDNVGVDGVVVSNHGGRQLDRTLSTIAALPAIVERVGNRADVYMDGGVRRGTDVITALALGAKGVFIGRPYLYGLAAKGEEGVFDVLQLLRNEIERDMILMGCADVALLDQSWLLPAAP
jgi:isopentenyl diphosphate isomerase/L-lactate dehydrogenase-like FMN-dependent dehydrogenase